MTVTAKQGSSPTVNRSNQFGTFAHDPNHTAFMTEPNYPYYQDAAGTPVTSPVALSGTAQPISVPAAAAAIVIIGAVDIRVSDTSAMGSGYAVIPAKTPVEIPIVTPGNDPNDTTGKMWIVNDTTSGNCSFFFKCV